MQKNEQHPYAGVVAELRAAGAHVTLATGPERLVKTLFKVKGFTWKLDRLSKKAAREF